MTLILHRIGYPYVQLFCFLEPEPRDVHYTTVLSFKSDSDVMFCLQSYQ